MFFCAFLSNKRIIISNIFVLALTIVLFGILIKNDLLLKEIGANLIFVSVVISVHSVFYHLFLDEYSSGVIEQMLLQPVSVIHLMIRKIAYQIFFYEFSILLIVPILSIIMNLNSDITYRLMLSLGCSIPIIITISSIGGALSMRKNDNSVIMSVIVLPLLIPISILGNSIIYNTTNNQEILLLLSLVLITLPVNIMAICYLLQIAVEHE